MAKYKESKKKAFARGYVTGLDHAKTLKDAHHRPVGEAAKRGYSKGMKHGRYIIKQRNTYNSWGNKWKKD